MAESKESPTIEEPKKKEPVKGKARPEVDELLAELNKIGVEKPEQIQGMFRASGEAGRLANMVGELRAEIASMKSQPRNREPVADPFAYETGENIEATVEKVLTRFVTNQQVQAQKMQQAIWDEYSSITSDEDYDTVRDVWDEHMRNPNVQYRINTGQSTPTREYANVVRRYYRKVAQRSKEVIEGLTNPASTKPPHMESGHPSSVAPEIPEDDKTEKIKNIQKNRKGNDDDIDALLDAVLPRGSIVSMRG